MNFEFFPKNKQITMFVFKGFKLLAEWTFKVNLQKMHSLFFSFFLGKALICFQKNDTLRQNLCLAYYMSLRRCVHKFAYIIHIAF